MKKKGAVGLSMSTIVIVIISLSVLILGLVLTKNIMCAAMDGIGDLDDQMKNEIRSLFGANDKLVVKESVNEIVKGVSYGVGFGILNQGQDSEDFSYIVKASDVSSCSFSLADADDFVVLGKSSSVKISPGDDYSGLIKFEIPKSVESCHIRYSIEVMNEGSVYAFNEFDVEIKSKSFTQNFCWDAVLT